MIGPIPLMVIAAIAAIWFIVPRKIADNATDQAVLAGRSIATHWRDRNMVRNGGGAFHRIINRHSAGRSQ
jgi:hypothetical protein